MKPGKEEVFISTDIEADGPIPGPNSMLSLGAAAYLSDKTLLGTFSVNIELLPDASADPDTWAWWQTQGNAYQQTRVDIKPAQQAMHSDLIIL
jgi:hypothetical protein